MHPQKAMLLIQAMNEAQIEYESHVSNLLPQQCTFSCLNASIERF